MEIQIKSPDECTSIQLKAFADRVRLGGEVMEHGLEARIRHAKLLALGYEGSELVGIAALKNPDIRYRQDIFKRAVSQLDPERFIFELGWIYINPELRRHGLSKSMIEALLAAVKTRDIFATVRVDNIPMTGILSQLKFCREGLIYFSQLGQYDLELFVFSPNLEVSEMVSKQALVSVLQVLRVIELKAALSSAGLASSGYKDDLVDRLAVAIRNENASFEENILDVVDDVFYEAIANAINELNKTQQDRFVQIIPQWFYDNYLGGNTEEKDEDEEYAPQDTNDDCLNEMDSYRSESYRNQFFNDLRYEQHHFHETRPYQKDAMDALEKALSYERPIVLHVATGGGKTRIANDFVVKKIHQGQQPILWVAKDWRLLHQAALDLIRRHAHLNINAITRLGGDGALLHPLREITDSLGIVIYSTLQTAGRKGRLGVFTKRNRPKLVVYDEFHWGLEGKTGQRLRNWCKRHKIPIIGLTATPRSPDGTNTYIAYSKNFSALIVEEFLAEPKLETIGTNIDWSPRMIGDDVSSASLGELGDSQGRNNLIVNHYCANARRYGKTLVFACNINHADKLGDLFKKRGVAVRVVHSQMTRGGQQEAIQAFLNNQVQVLINVAQMTHGVDIPDIRTIFMCRPTASDILFSQMIGRGCRRYKFPNGTFKTFFYLVEFTDNLQRHDIKLITSKTYFDGCLGSNENSSRVVVKHPHDGEIAFDSTGVITWIASGVPELIRGLCYRHNQSFGIEFEFTHKDFDLDDETMPNDWWFQIAEQLRQSLHNKLPSGTVASQLEGDDKRFWNVKFDRSCGWEVTSRVLRNQDGFNEVVIVCEVLTECIKKTGLKVNYRTGTHIHLGWLGRTVDEVRRAIELARLFEPALGTLVSPSRLMEYPDQSGGYNPANPNYYCQPVSRFYSNQNLEQVKNRDQLLSLCSVDDSRYVTFNICPLENIHTVEVRMHNGTHEADKILLWLSLWMQILWAAAHSENIPPVPDCGFIIPNGDVIDLADKYLAVGTDAADEFLAKLRRRRMQVVEIWRAQSELRSWLEYQNSWRTDL